MMLEKKAAGDHELVPIDRVLHNTGINYTLSGVQLCPIKIVPTAPSGLSMIPIPGPFSGDYGDGMRPGARDGEII